MAPTAHRQTLEERLPPWLKGQGRGWVTAEYGMLPRATLERTRREASAGKQNGCDFTVEEAQGFLLSLKPKEELSDDDLESVAGGLISPPQFSFGGQNFQVSRSFVISTGWLATLGGTGL